MKAIIFDTDNRIVGIVPDSAIEPARNPFFIPESPGQWVVTPLTGVRIDRLGKGVAERFADRYFSEVISAVHPSDGTANPVEWSRDGALLVGNAASKDQYPVLTTAMTTLVAAAAVAMTLKTGDLVLRLAGTTQPANAGDTAAVDLPDAPPTTYKIR